MNKEICSDKELKEIAEQWCQLVGEKPTPEILDAFCMGEKIAISNNGWVKIKQSKDEQRRKDKTISDLDES